LLDVVAGACYRSEQLLRPIAAGGALLVCGAEEVFNDPHRVAPESLRQPPQ
jgi:hypothetical protein